MKDTVFIIFHFLKKFIEIKNHHDQENVLIYLTKIARSMKLLHNNCRSSLSIIILPSENLLIQQIYQQVGVKS